MSSPIFVKCLSLFAIPVVIVTQQWHLIGFALFLVLLEAILDQDVKSHDPHQHAYCHNARFLRRILGELINDGFSFVRYLPMT